MSEPDPPDVSSSAAIARVVRELWVARYHQGLENSALRARISALEARVHAPFVILIPEDRRHRRGSA